MINYSTQSWFQQQKAFIDALPFLKQYLSPIKTHLGFLVNSSLVSDLRDVIHCYYHMSLQNIQEIKPACCNP